MEQHEHKTNGEIDNDKVWAVLAYIFFPLPLLLVKNRSAFLNYHINQGIIFDIILVVGYFIFGAWLAFFGWIFKLCMAILFILGIMNVSNKKKVALPIIGNLFNFIKDK